MIPVVCFSSLLFGNWPLEWNEKNQRFEISYYFILTSIFMSSYFFYLFFTFLNSIIEDDSIISNPQYIIISLIYLNLGVMVLNRLVNAGHSARFADELKRNCGRTVESGRHLTEFWLRTAVSALMLCVLHYKYRRFTDMSTTTIVMQITLPLSCCVYAGSTMEDQYTAACGAIAQEFASMNHRVRGLHLGLHRPDVRRDQWATSERLARLSEAHCRLARLVRLFNDEYGASIFFTTVGLLLCQIYSMNDVVSIIVVSDTLDATYERYAYALDAFTWLFTWARLWWICYRSDDLTEQVHLTAKIMLEKDINSFPDNTRKMALDFLDQLLHRHVRITAWGFYDVNKELLFIVLGYQFGLSLICTQFTTSGIQLVNSLTTVQTNSTAATKT